jgi:aminoglycoside phosphotransferase (APT) family kinase protein
MVLCHNDLGIEHILVIDNKIAGIIDWGGVAITDPACDFARIYRDVGEKVFHLVLNEYIADDATKAELRERAVFYGKCLLFEDLYYGAGQEEYEQKVFNALAWMF